MKRFNLIWIWAGVVALSAGGCGKSEPQTPPARAGEEISTQANSKLADFVIYNGRGVDPTDSESLEKIIRSHGHSAILIDDRELNAWTAEEFAKYGTFIWPGGDNADMAVAISNSARRQLRKAVLSNGLNYVGFCAGAFIAMGPRADVDALPYSGLALIDGPYPPQYLPRSRSYISMVKTKFADGTFRDLMLWYGPFFITDQGVIARYADDNLPAMIQRKVNEALVILSGAHPEAPRDWQHEGGLIDSDGEDFDIAWRLLEAAHLKKPLPAF